MIKVLVVFHDTIYSSGGTRSLLDLVDSLIQDQYIELICLFPRKVGTAIDYLKDKPVTIITCRYWYATGPISDTVIGKQLLKIKFILGKINIYRLIYRKLSRLKIDIVYTNTGVIFAGAWISSSLKVPHIWHIREFLDTDHGISPLMGWDKYYKFVNAHTTVAIMISEALRQKHQRGIDLQKIKVIHDDLSPRYLLSQELPWNDRKCNILFAGTICEGKGQLIAIKALSILHKKGLTPKLYIAGTVKERDQYYYDILKKEISEKNLTDKVDFLGQVQDLSGIRKQCGIGIVASKSEAFGRVTIEGMLAGMIMIGADMAGTSELIQDGQNGFLFPLGEVQRLAEILEFVMTADEKIIRTVRTNAIKKGKRFISGACAENIRRIIYCCLGEDML